MGNCSLKGVSDDCSNSIRVLTDSGSIIEFNGPKLAGEVLNDYPGYGIFLQCKASSPLPSHERLVSGKSYYLLPLGNKNMLCSDGVSQSLEAEWMKNVNAAEPETAKKSSSAASEFVESLSNGPALEVLPSGGDGVWKVKLMIDTKQLEEIFSEQGNTEALIERMRMVASSASLTPRHAKSFRGGGWMPSFPNLFKVPN
ncbi:uncharacterized protein LOC107429808 [Ziziphus jujuba]|uniref:Uncharacterized protein LOC107429808 n=2 Tax=Ziziphus jujuba TaxID=326968 RepID=A0A6P4ALL7_ZIZJJ|nr:uncharacterized protein LOC107429808 [Ziziphus jujuba]KAH7513718.1 hypothetical protein FEM48_Zijuj11G0010900 [Ziziphus jujuba var. spinosa]